MEPAARFAELISRPTDPAPLDVLASLLGAAFEPATDIDRTLGGLDEVAASCGATFESVLGTLFGSGRFAGNSADYGDPRNSYLHRVLQRGLGIPISLSVVAIEVGRRVGVPIRGVGLPGHFMVVCDGVYADPFHGGRTCTADSLDSEWRRVTGAPGRLDPQLTRPVPARAIVLRMLNNLKNTFVAMDDPIALRTLALLRGAFPELVHERAEHARWLRHWN